MFQVLPLFQLVIFGIVIILGLVNAIHPRFLWEKFEGWKAKEEPSPAYFLMRRIGGILAVLIVIGLIAYPHMLMNF